MVDYREIIKGFEDCSEVLVTSSGEKSFEETVLFEDIHADIDGLYIDHDTGVFSMLNKHIRSFDYDKEDNTVYFTFNNGDMMSFTAV